MAIRWNGEQIEYLLLGDFRFKDRFIGIDDSDLCQALQMVNAQFSGVYRLWAFLPPGERKAKRELCINYLLAWQLAYTYPDKATGLQGVGAMPLASKKVGPIFLKYRDMVRQSGSGMLDMLTTNEYGMQALTMIQTAPENFLLYR